MASLNSHETTKGMRVKFNDVECYRDHMYEYNDYDDPEALKEFTVWKPPSLDEIKKEEEKPEPAKEKPAEADIYTDMFADELGLRSLKNQSGHSDVEQLDLSFLDYDAIDVLEVDMNTTLEVKTKTENAQNETLFSDWTEVDGLNFTAVDLLNQSISENSTHLQNSSAPTTFDDSAVGEITNLAVPLQETTTLTATLGGNTSSVLETEGINVTLTGDNQTSIAGMLAEDSEERLTRGDVFSYSSPPSNSSTNNFSITPEGNATSLSHSAQVEDENNTAAHHVNTSGDGTNHSLPVPTEDIGEVNIISIERSNSTILELELDSTDNETSNNDSLITTAEPEYDLQMNSSEIVTNSSLEMLETGSLQNLTVNLSISNSSEEISSNVTALLGEFNHTSSLESSSNDTNLSLSSNGVGKSTSAELGGLDSSEEVLIYLTKNNTQVIKTTSVKTLGHNWTYEGTHQMEPVEIPDYLMKYLGKETPQTTPTPKKKTRKVNLRQRPQKGQGMKTKKRKEYKPQSRSGLPFSPRGFNPGMTPRGSRPLSPKPVSDEEETIDMAVVIGVPRPDFSDYDIYVPRDEQDHTGTDVEELSADEYEYVTYIDPYSSHEDIKNLNLDDTTKYFLKYSGPNVKTYFIAAEEVDWDYSGYGQR